MVGLSFKLYIKNTVMAYIKPFLTYQNGAYHIICTHSVNSSPAACGCCDRSQLRAAACAYAKSDACRCNIAQVMPLLSKANACG